MSYPAFTNSFFLAIIFAFFSLMFTHLNCHSVYSLLEGANRIGDLVKAATQMGISELALTDTNGLYGAVTFYKSAKQAGIRPIFGTEIQSNGQRAVLLAKNMTGFGEICRIVTDRHLKEYFSLLKSLRECGNDVIILCPDQKLLDGIVKERGTKDIAVELTRFGNSLIGNLMSYSRRHSLPMVATNRVFFIQVEGWETHRLLSTIRTNSTIHTIPKNAVVSPDAWLKPPNKMTKLFSDCPQAIQNSLRIAEQCQVDLSIGKIKLPPFDVPEGETAFSFLEKLAWKGAKKLYRSFTTAVQERLSFELGIIRKLSLASYFLVVWDIIKEAHRRGILTVGRGSAANSLVCRTLGITEVDPIHHNLYFERFLSLERADCPDIDIDFPWNRRDEMLDYVFKKYGHKNVALISTHIHLRGRSTLREVGKAMGIPTPEINAFTSKLPHFAKLSELKEIQERVPECRELPIEDEPYRSMIRWSRKIEGFPRHLSIHCGGIVVSPDPITDTIPLQKTPKGFVVTQYDMGPVEDMGLLKIDFLSQMGLAVEVDTVQAIHENYNIRMDFSKADATQDEKTKELIRNGDTVGCFYIESPGMRNLLRNLDVTDFDMLTAVSSIIRPGISDSGMMKAFINRHNGKETVHYLHSKLKNVLQKTYGIMIYQEDVIKVANTIAMMSLGEAEGLRKCMSKKRDRERIENYKDRFLSGAKKNGVAKETAQEIWRQIKSFAGYAFCKAHSASFAMVSYRAAYLKAHYPAEFMASVLSNQGGFYGTDEYIEEARRMGLKILLPHVNHSRREFFSQSYGKTIRRSAIRVGLMQVKNLSRKTIDKTLEERNKKPYVSLGDFHSRVKANEHEIDFLIRCGALDGLGDTRPAMLWKYGMLENKIKKSQEEQVLFPMNDANHFNKIPKLPEYVFREKLIQELECLGVAVSHHPLLLYGIKYGNRTNGILPAKSLHRHSGKVGTLVGWLVTYKRTRTDKGELMKLITLEDSTGLFEAILFPKVYRRFGHLLQGRGPYIVKGWIKRNGRCHTVTVLWLGKWTEDRLNITHPSNVGTDIFYKSF